MKLIKIIKASLVYLQVYNVYKKEQRKSKNYNNIILPRMFMHGHTL